MLQQFAGGAVFGTATGEVGAASVLALHGWARTHRDFDRLLGGVGEASIASVALDQPGFGASPPPPGPWGTLDYADCLLEVIDTMAAPVVVLGHSFGGRVALQLAATHPELVRALVLTGVPLPISDDVGRRPAGAFRVLRALHRAGLVSESKMEQARQRHGSADYRNAQGVMRQVLVRVLAERYDVAIAHVQCPVSLVWSSDDTEAPLAQAERAVGRLANASLSVHEGAGHLTPLTIPDALRQAVLDHLP